MYSISLIAFLALEIFRSHYFVLKFLKIYIKFVFVYLDWSWAKSSYQVSKKVVIVLHESTDLGKVTSSLQNALICLFLFSATASLLLNSHPLSPILRAEKNKKEAWLKLRTEICMKLIDFLLFSICLPAV